MSWQSPIRRINVAESWRRAKAEFAAVVAERDALKRECNALSRDCDALERELANTRARLREMHASILARYEAWQELTALHREHQIERARKAERDPAQPLH